VLLKKAVSELQAQPFLYQAAIGQHKVNAQLLYVTVEVS
jgi:hypothetical protein